jgi:trypsin
MLLLSPFLLVLLCLNLGAASIDVVAIEEAPAPERIVIGDGYDPVEQSRHLSRKNRGREELNTRIVGGGAALEGFYPHQVQILSSNGEMICGGSLVAADLVICAAHCTAYAYKVGIGRHTNPDMPSSAPPGASEQVIDICQKINHEDYDKPWARDSYDIALYQLCSPVENYGPKYYISLNADASIPVESTQTTTSSLTVTGWGALAAGGLSAAVLQEVDVDYIPNDTCRGSQTQYSFQDIREDMLCAGKLGVGGKDSCQGDSGGPLMIKGQDPLTTGYYNPHVLVGVVSWGYGCAEKNAPGVYARISYFKDWITANAGNSQLKWSTGGIVVAPSGEDNDITDVSVAPSHVPSSKPSVSPSSSQGPSFAPSEATSFAPSALPSWMPSVEPTTSPSMSVAPSVSQDSSTSPTSAPSNEPTTSQVPSEKPISQPSRSPSANPTTLPSSQPTTSEVPSAKPTSYPSRSPSATPTSVPSSKPTTSRAPSGAPVTNTSVIIVENGDTLSTPGAGRIRPVIYKATFNLEATLEDGCVDSVNTFTGRSGHTRDCSWIQKVGRPGAIMSPNVRARKVNSRCKNYGTRCPAMCGFCAP